MKPNQLLNILKQELIPALGCTEPAAVALAAAYANEVIMGPVQKMKIIVSSNIYKNAKAAGIPGTDRTGTEIAALLGTTLKNPTLNLTIFKDLTPEVIAAAIDSLATIPLELVIKKMPQPGVYIDVSIEKERSASRAIIEGTHANLVHLERNGKTALHKTPAESEDNLTPLLTEYSLDSLLTGIMALPDSELEFLQAGIDMNLKIAEAGLAMTHGLQLGARWQAAVKKGLIGADIASKITGLTGAASDARMAGYDLPVMSVAGSGNHGLAAILPVAVAGQELNCSPEQLHRAIAISLLVTLQGKAFSGRLSPACGCVTTASAGASAGIVYLLGGDSAAIANAVEAIYSCLTGTICDGGKTSCALKLCAGVSMAWSLAVLAVGGLKTPVGNGVVGENASETIRNSSLVVREGMALVDDALVSVMRGK